jgi:hypothetical protein
MESAQPQHRLGDKLEAHLKALEVHFMGRCEELAEDAELVFRKAGDHIGVDPGVRVVPGRRSGAMECLRGDKHLKLAGRMLVLRERQIAPKEAQGQPKQGYTQEWMGHSKGSSRIRIHAPVIWLL